MDWITNIKSFIEVVETNSFSKAAQKRFSSPATISRRINWLEEMLGVQLLHRTTRNLKLTSEGLVFYEKSKKLLENLADLQQDLQSSDEIAGSIKLTMPLSYGDYPGFLNPLQRFLEKYPKINLVLDFSNAKRDLLAHGIDVALRLSPVEGSGYVSEQVASVTVGVYASPQYLQKHGEPKTLKELSQHNCLLNENVCYVDWEFKDKQKVRVSGNLQANSTQPLISYALKGMGMISIFDTHVAKALAQGKLKPVLQAYWREARPLYLVYRSDVGTPKRVKCLVDYLLLAFEQNSIYE